MERTGRAKVIEQELGERENERERYKRRQRQCELEGKKEERDGRLRGGKEGK